MKDLKTIFENWNLNSSATKTRSSQEHMRCAMSQLKKLLD